MGIKLNSVKCPECSAILSIEEGRNQLFCTYCGTKVIVTNENEKIFRHINEAEIKYAETAQLVRLKELELLKEEKRLEEKNNVRNLKISIALVVLGVIMIVVGILLANASDDSDSPFFILVLTGMLSVMAAFFIKSLSNKKEADDGKIRVPSAIYDYKNSNYVTIEEQFKSAGFSNVKSYPLNNLSIGLLKKPGRVELITINGEEASIAGSRQLPIVPVVITYYSFMS